MFLYNHEKKKKKKKERKGGKQIKNNQIKKGDKTTDLKVK